MIPELNDSLDGLFDSDAPPKTAPTGVAWDRIRALDGATPVAAAYTEPCTKCRGRGRFISYAGRDCGPCFTCEGRGSKTFKTSGATRAKATERRAMAPVYRWEDFAKKHPAEAAWIIKSAPTFEFAASLRASVEKYGELSPRQLAAAQKCVARDVARTAGPGAARVTGPQDRAQDVDASKIVTAIQNGRASGLKWVCLRFDGLTIYEAKKHLGVLYVKAGRGEAGVYLGKISDDRFIPSRECDAATIAKVVLIASDPANAARVYGLQTGTCCCCGRELTDPVSVAAGIGPICGSRFGF